MFAVVAVWDTPTVEAAALAVPVAVPASAGARRAMAVRIGAVGERYVERAKGSDNSASRVVREHFVAQRERHADRIA